MITKQCPQCGKHFEGRANKVYCSHNCKMAAFYGSNTSIETVNELSVDQLSVNGLQEELPQKQLTVLLIEKESTMVSVPVYFTNAEKSNLEQQAHECETALAKLIRIRSLMDETDIWSMQETIEEQKSQIEELRVKLSFFQGQGKNSELVKPSTDLSVNGLLIPMTEKQKEFLKELYIKTQCAQFDVNQEDIDNWEVDEDEEDEDLKYPPELNDERVELNQKEKTEPGYLLQQISEELIHTYLFQIVCELNEDAKKKNSKKRHFHLVEDYKKLSNK